MMIFGGQVLACYLADRHPSHGHGLRSTNAGSLTAHKVRMPVDEHEFIYVAALSDKGQLLVRKGDIRSRQGPSASTS